MSKAILVIEMPENCSVCELYDRNEFGDEARCFLRAITADENTRPKHCPLRALPEKMEFSNTHSDQPTPSYKVGYNACIEEILGEA